MSAQERITSTAAAVEQIKAKADRTARQVLAIVAAVSLITLAIVGTFFVVYVNDVSSSTARQQRLAQDNHTALQILETATSPQATKAQADSLKHVVGCILNRIDVDTGKAQGLLPNCP